MEINLCSIAFLEENMKNVDAIHMHLALFFFIHWKKASIKGIFLKIDAYKFIFVFDSFLKDTTSFASSSGK